MTRIEVQHSNLLKHQKRLGSAAAELKDLKDASARVPPNTMAKGLAVVEAELATSEKYLARLQKQAEDNDGQTGYPRRGRHYPEDPKLAAST